MSDGVSMKQPPSGVPIERGNGDDADAVAHLRKQGRCQQRLRTDGGRHYIFCGAYYHGPCRETARGLRCRFHFPPKGTR